MAGNLNNIHSKKNESINQVHPQQIPIMNIATYCSFVSKDPFEDGISLQSQKELIRGFIEKDQNFTNYNKMVFDYLDDGISVTETRHEQLEKLLEDIEKNSIDFVITLRLDRITRSFENLQQFLKILESKQVIFISIKEKINTGSTTGKFFISILDSLVQVEHEKNLEVLKDSFGHLLRDKSLGGATPFGYLYSFVDEGKYTAYTQENATKYNLPPIKVYDKTNDDIFPGTYVKYICDWFLSYSSISKVAKRLNDLAIPIPRVVQDNIKIYQSKRATNSRMSKYILISNPGFWSRTTVRDILLNPFYTGVRVLNRFEDKSRIGQEIVDWFVIDDSHEKIIDENTFMTITALYDEIKKKN